MLQNELLHLKRRANKDKIKHQLSENSLENITSTISESEDVDFKIAQPKEVL